MKKSVYVVGGGAAGIMAAITAAREGANVSILEHNDRIGKKILSTGNGRCNYTNVYQAPEHYRSDNVDFPWKVIEKYTAEQAVSEFRDLGILEKVKNGGVYPFSEQATAVLDVLRTEVERLRIQVITNVHVHGIRPQKNGYRILATLKEENKEKTFFADSIVLATGSKAASKLGSDGSGYDLAKSLGHKIVPVVPALVQLKCKENYFKSITGVRLQGKVTLYVNGEKKSEDTGELQLTAYGISGIPVFQISRYAGRAIYEKKRVTAQLDIMPVMDLEELTTYLSDRAKKRPQKDMEMFLVGMIHKKVASVILKNAGIPLKKLVKELSSKEIVSLAKAMKYWEVTVVDTNPFEQAQICAGGVDTREISVNTMESKGMPGIYFAGELVDVDGICGGYNLQWAWSSGYLAGKEAARA